MTEPNDKITKASPDMYEAIKSFVGKAIDDNKPITEYKHFVDILNKIHS